MILVYGLGLLAFERIRSSSSKRPEAQNEKATGLQYVLAGRRLTLFPFIATMVATAYGWVLGVGELYARFGISAWLFLSLPYSLATLFFALFMARKARSMGFITLTDLLQRFYGRKVANFGTLLFLVLCSPAMYLLMGAQVVDYAGGLDIGFGLLLVTGFSVLYLFGSGFEAVVRTDTLQFGWMYFGFGLLLAATAWQQGHAPLARLPHNLTQWSLNYSPAYLLSWLLLAGYNLIDPNFYQRIYALESAHTARRGLLIAVGFWTLFDFLAATTALYALGLGFAESEPAYLYLRLAQSQLPAPLAAFVMVGVMAAILSTVDSFVFYSGVALGRDLLRANGYLKGRPMSSVVRWAVAVTALAALALAFAYRRQTAVDLFLEWHPLAVSALLWPVLGAYVPAVRLSARMTLVQMVAAGAATAVYQVLKSDLTAIYPALKPVESVVVGAGTALILGLAGLVQARLR